MYTLRSDAEHISNYDKRFVFEPRWGNLLYSNPDVCGRRWLSRAYRPITFTLFLTLSHRPVMHHRMYTRRGDELCMDASQLEL